MRLFVTKKYLDNLRSTYYADGCAAFVDMLKTIDFKRWSRINVHAGCTFTEPLTIDGGNNVILQCLFKFKKKTRVEHAILIREPAIKPEKRVTKDVSKHY